MIDRTNDAQPQQQCRRVGLVYDERMCKHATPNGEPHHENPERIRAIWNKLVSAGIPKRCEVFKAKEVEDKYVEAVHAKVHTRLIKTISSMTDFERICMGVDDSIYFNEGSSESAYLAAGSVLEVAEKVDCGDADYVEAWDSDILFGRSSWKAWFVNHTKWLCTPNGYAILLMKLMEFSSGKIIMALEGGYNLDSLANLVLACVELLLEDKRITESTDVREELSTYWPILADKLPEKLTSRVAPLVQQTYNSESDDEYDDGSSALPEDLQEDVTIPVSKLKLTHDTHA
ncbi:histone deacetylase 5 [Tanacetum coccineum]